MRKGTKRGITAGLALALTLCVVVGAFALSGGFGLLEALRRERSLAPLEGAEALVQTELGAVERDGYRLELSEAVYVGRSLLLAVDVTLPEGQEEEAAALSVSLTEGGDVEEAWQYEETEELPEGVTYRTYYDVLLREGAEEEVEVFLDLPAMEDGEILEDIELRVRIGRTQDARSAAFAPDGESEAPTGMEILAIRADYTDIEAVLVIDYAVEAQLTQITYYGTAFGTFFHADEHCSGMEGAVELADLEGKLPCPVCAGTARRIRIQPMNGEGEAIAVADRSDYAYAVDPAGRVLRRQTLRLQTETEIPRRLELALEESEGTTPTRIGCVREDGE